MHTALLLADPSITAEAGYVGLSRGTHANHLYLDTSTQPYVEPACQPTPAWTRPARAARDRNDDLMRRHQQQQLGLEQLLPREQVVRPEGPSR